MVAGQQTVREADIAIQVASDDDPRILQVELFAVVYSGDDA